MADAAADPRTEAARRRRALHLSIARRNLLEMRQAIISLYVDEASPLHQQDEDIRRVQTYAPIVEAAILAHVFAPETPLRREMALNLEHTHASFGVPRRDYEAIAGQLARLEADPALDPRAVDWCVGTCMHGKAKPWRHERFFFSPETSD